MNLNELSNEELVRLYQSSRDDVYFNHLMSKNMDMLRLIHKKIHKI